MIDLSEFSKTALDAWGLVASGSLEVHIKEGEEVVSFTLLPDHLVVDIGDMEKVKEFLPVLISFRGISEAEGTSTNGGGGEIFNMLDLVKKIAKDLNDAGKTVSINFQGREVIRIGKGAHSLALSLMNYKYIEIKRKMLAVKLGIGLRNML